MEEVNYFEQEFFNIKFIKNLYPKILILNGFGIFYCIIKIDLKIRESSHLKVIKISTYKRNLLGTFLFWFDKLGN